MRSLEARSRVDRATRHDVARKLSGMPYSASRRAPSRLEGPRAWAFLTGDDYPSYAYATEATAMGLPPFGRGVALLCNAIAGTNWWAMRWDASSGVNVRLPDQPAVLLDPNPETTPWHYRWATTEDLILYGNHFALYGEPDWRTSSAGGTDRPGWLVPLSATDVWLIVDPETARYSWAIGGELIDAADMLHISAGARSGEILGRGVLAQYGAWLGGVLAAEDHAAAYFAGGALPPAVLQAPVVLTQPQAEELKAKWREMTNTREPVVLPSGYVLTPVVSNAEQAQLVESRTWNAEMVAMLLGIPGYKLGLQGPSMTYQNIETADIEFVRDSVDRYAHPISEAFSKWLMPRGTSVTWDYVGRMRADTKTSAEVVTMLTNAKILTINEGRAMLNRVPLDEPPALPAPPDPDPTPVPPAPDEPEPLTPQSVT